MLGEVTGKQTTSKGKKDNNKICVVKRKGLVHVSCQDGKVALFLLSLPNSTLGQKKITNSEKLLERLRIDIKSCRNSLS